MFHEPGFECLSRQLTVSISIRFPECCPLGSGKYPRQDVCENQPSSALDDGILRKPPKVNERMHLVIRGCPPVSFESFMPYGFRQERMLESVSHGDPTVTVKFQHSCQEIHRIIRKFVFSLCTFQSVQHPFPVFRHLRQGYEVLASGEEELSGKQHEEHDAAAEDIACGPIDSIMEFRCHVLWCASALSLHVIHLESTACTQINHLQEVQVFPCIHEILWLDVVMTHQIGVASAHCFQHVPHHRSSLPLRHECPFI
mmetsp:Transcript_26776/g.48827  ORF Transcript_26776/g.48827 Transcript_26776/m.48827 type:complete len:256 (-) Transcript_26776:602-1369(-)